MTGKDRGVIWCVSDLKDLGGVIIAEAHRLIIW